MMNLESLKNWPCLIASNRGQLELALSHVASKRGQPYLVDPHEPVFVPFSLKVVVVGKILILVYSNVHIYCFPPAVNGHTGPVHD